MEPVFGATLSSVPIAVVVRGTVRWLPTLSAQRRTYYVTVPDDEDSHNRDEGETVSLPVLRGRSELSPQWVEYQLLQPVIEWVRLWRWQVNKKEAEDHLRWLNETESGRVQAIWTVFRQAGLEDLSAAPDELIALASFIQSWYPQVMAPYIVTWPNHLSHLPDVRMPAPGLGTSLEASLAHDIAFIVAAEMRKANPELTWGAITERGRRGATRAFIFPAPDGRDLAWLARRFLQSAIFLSSQDRSRFIDDPIRYPTGPAGMRLELRHTVDEMLRKL
jgi:hypothetical protein